MKTAKPKPDDDDGRIVKAAYIARRLGVAPMTISKLASEGVVLSYSERMRAGSSGRDSAVAKQRARLEKIRGDRLELSLAREMGTLVVAAEMEAYVKADFRAIRQAFLALPDRVGSRAVLSRSQVALLKEEVEAVLTDLAHADDDPPTEEEIVIALAQRQRDLAAGFGHAHRSNGGKPPPQG